MKEGEFFIFMKWLPYNHYMGLSIVDQHEIQSNDEPVPPDA